MSFEALTADSGSAHNLETKFESLKRKSESFTFRFFIELLPSHHKPGIWPKLIGSSTSGAPTGLRLLPFKFLSPHAPVVAEIEPGW
ncbi:uncharacterized protein BDCG_16599 [Blastomyces dermatitidis ER-3]|uniref:Uncharacterized protein n=3 Tax=Blastomyces TaxID=229219 RepID=A0A179USL3_BLAGS|nr:uncharacterized protein BDBG_17299 [Blastomyces gilchristii SLH14081]XP_045280076.1 uncharacterized protein BDCG_16599 [Blastomyces dermatitidis ER-3]EQL38321.1 hypothetical protein BDFG_00678 [Blastomyces dermatitidis ATCC 26199]KMW66639.1 hypothetical protein BDDG_11629 [Blastomyces dermatitidis ATCC 18188]OAT00349.1 hypothetical protein BDCG_16599 [Blastomyces dermatitidis ER-3]OAT10057.1 hypothetical protein BDBG_17299 [Blastomyces gilchristii SLH14081]